MIPIELLISAPTSDDVFGKMLTLLEVVGVPARSWREGGVARTLLAVGCEYAAGGAKIVADCVAGGYLTFATGVYLAAHAKDVYDVDKIEATFATGFVTLTNKGGAIHSAGANEAIVKSSNTGARFRITVPFVLASGSEAVPTVSAPLAVQAIDAGAASSVGPAEIDELETPLSRTTVTNVAAIIGTDAETDDQLRVRCMAKRGTWSPFGPRDAYEHAALSALLSDGSPTNVSRVAVSRYSSTGIVTIVCATPSGTPTAAELQAVEDEVEAKARPDSVTAIVSGAVPVATAHSIVLWAKGGTEALLLANAQAAVAALIAAYPIGGIAKEDGGQGYLYADAIAAAAIGSSVEAFDVDFVGGGDVALAANEVATNTTAIEVRIR